MDFFNDCSFTCITGYVFVLTAGPVPTSTAAVTSNQKEPGGADAASVRPGSAAPAEADGQAVGQVQEAAPGCLQVCSGTTA